MRALVPPCLSPEGLRLWSINSEGVHVKSSYKVGRFLSNGNQGRVYEVLRVVNDDDSNRRCHRRGNGPTAQTQWAIKLSPTMHAFAWNNLTEKQSKQVRFNLDSVDRERALYGKESMTKFLGKLIPNIPSEKAGDVPRYGYLFPDEDNTEKPIYKYLVVELLDLTLDSASMQLHLTETEVKDIWKRLLEIVYSILASEKGLELSLKPENIMFAFESFRGQALADCLRLIDFGGMKRTRLEYDYRGDPYPSDRDPMLDAFFTATLISAEVAIGVHAYNEERFSDFVAHEGFFEGCAMFLPWLRGYDAHDGSSDYAVIDKIKNEQLGDFGSEFYKTLPFSLRIPMYNVLTYLRTMLEQPPTELNKTNVSDKDVALLDKVMSLTEQTMETESTTTTSLQEHVHLWLMLLMMAILVLQKSDSRGHLSSLQEILVGSSSLCPTLCRMVHRHSISSRLLKSAFLLLVVELLFLLLWLPVGSCGSTRGNRDARDDETEQTWTSFEEKSLSPSSSKPSQ